MTSSNSPAKIISGEGTYIHSSENRHYRSNTQQNDSPSKRRNSAYNDLKYVNEIVKNQDLNDV